MCSSDNYPKNENTLETAINGKKWPQPKHATFVAQTANVAHNLRLFHLPPYTIHRKTDCLAAYDSSLLILEHKCISHLAKLLPYEAASRLQTFNQALTPELNNYWRLQKNFNSKPRKENDFGQTIIMFDLTREHLTTTKLYLIVQCKTITYQFAQIFSIAAKPT